MSKKNKHNNDDEDPGIFRYYPIIAIFALAFFGASLGIGLSKDIDWLVTLGVVILAVTISVMSLSKTIWFFWTVATVMKEKRRSGQEKDGKTADEESDYYECDDDGNASADAPSAVPSAAAPAQIDSKVDGDKEQSGPAYKKSSDPPPSKHWSRGDKAKVFLIFGSLGLTLLTFAVGIFFAKIDITSIGFPLMGAGGGGFALIIFVLIIASVVQDRKRK